MSTTISIEAAQANLPQIIGGLASGQEIVLTEDQKPVAALRSLSASNRRPQFGNCRGMLTIVSEDDEHLQDFADYMP